MIYILTQLHMLHGLNTCAQTLLCLQHSYDAFCYFLNYYKAQKGQKKCGNCIKDCIDEDSDIAAKKQDFIDTCDADEKCIIDCDSTDCVAACDGKKKCVKKCKKTQKKCEKKKAKKEKVCKKKCVMGLMNKLRYTPDLYSFILFTVIMFLGVMMK